jgi:hypothetical protein
MTSAKVSAAHATTFKGGSAETRQRPKPRARKPESAAAIGKNRKPIPAVEARDCMIDHHPLARAARKSRRLTRIPRGSRLTASVMRTAMYARGIAKIPTMAITALFVRQL